MQSENSVNSVGVAGQVYRNARSFPIILLVMAVFWLVFMLTVMHTYNAGFHALTAGASTLMVLGGQSNGVVQRLTSL